MKQKASVLINKGMSRDLSSSKAGDASVFENHNIRITADVHGTLLSVTNERGNKKVNFSIAGDLLGWNVLNNHIVLFTTTGTGQNPDYIYRVDYVDGEFVQPVLLFNGDLGFDIEHPIESVVYFETDNIQKIYWLDGKNVLRFMNFMASAPEIASWVGDNYAFDSNKPFENGLTCEISKDNSGNTRANGTVQYLVTYFNKHGQESGYAWVSDLVYLSPLNNGGAADGTNNNKVTLKFSGLDTSYSNFRVYSVFRSTNDGTAVAYIVGDGKTSDDDIMIVDDGAHLVAEDAQRLLFLGSQTVKAGTLTHKDNVLFLGDIKSTGRDYSSLEAKIKESMFDQTDTWKAACVFFAYSDNSVSDGEVSNIPYIENPDTYENKCQLQYTSSQILSFKGGEKYRFALVFSDASGVKTDAFWIGDKVNQMYPQIDSANHEIRRIVAKCNLPAEVLVEAQNLGLTSVQLMIAKASYADRSVKAQGIINPTMFNTWDRYNGRTYALPSWISRPRASGFAFDHFAPVHNANRSTGEIEANYWTTDEDPTPFYRYQNYGQADMDFADEFDGMLDYDYLMIVYAICCSGAIHHYKSWMYVVKAKVNNNEAETIQELQKFRFNLSLFKKDKSDSTLKTYSDPSGLFDLRLYSKYLGYSGTGNPSRNYAYNKCQDYLLNDMEIPSSIVSSVTRSEFYDWCDYANTYPNKKHKIYVNTQFTSEKQSGYNDKNEQDALNLHWDDSQRTSRWIQPVGGNANRLSPYTPSYYRKHLMFVDENVVTLDSPELAYQAVSFDNASNFKFRIVGAAKISSEYADYTVEASHGKLSGENLVRTAFSGTQNKGNLDGLISWPLWKEYSLKANPDVEDFDEINPEDRTSADYVWDSPTVTYWLHLWNHVGNITLYDNDEDSNYSVLRKKTFANLRFSYTTLYNNYGVNDMHWGEVASPISIRICDNIVSQYQNIKIGNELKYYSGVVNEAVSTPGAHEYPILYSSWTPDTSEEITETGFYLTSNSPVQIAFDTIPHAVIALPTNPSKASGGRVVYEQEILPYLYGVEFQKAYFPGGNDLTGALLPWIDVDVSGDYPYKDYSLKQQPIIINSDLGYDSISEGERYLFIGEIYYDFDNDVNDTRYGGTSDSAIENNVFIPAGPSYGLDRMAFDGTDYIYGNQGDTYFQRWDCMKSKPSSESDANSIIDITSVMLETHINLDGRTDNQRGTKFLASIDTENFGKLNRAYSQQNDFLSNRDLDEDANLDSYRSSVTWTLPKTDSADIDEWSHITLASSLKLDGDKGVCRALRRFQNSIVAFQDRAVSEILFNSRTQLSTENGVPVEIANSGKVDGKSVITNKYGCLNKWSIVEGKAGLYFVDNINKAFCSFSGQVENISTKCGFSSWFKANNSIKEWNPEDFENFVSFYDKIHSDVYLVKGDESLVYNEELGAFTSFFDYASVPMMMNIEDKFVSFKNNYLWIQNEGFYGNFFDTQYDFWMWYRFAPEPLMDKIWTNIEYRADFFRVLDEYGDLVVDDASLAVGDRFDDDEGVYQEDATFDTLKVWDEYQTTPEVGTDVFSNGADPVRKKFRIWRLEIPRAEISDTNPYGLDRIRNPWVSVKISKKLDSENANRDLMQLHDFVIKYFE